MTVEPVIDVFLIHSLNDYRHDHIPLYKMRAGTFCIWIFVVTCYCPTILHKKKTSTPGLRRLPWAGTVGIVSDLLLPNKK